MKTVDVGGNVEKLKGFVNVSPIRSQVPLLWYN